MTSRTLLIGELHAKPYRIRRNSDGAIVGVATLRDSDRGSVRFWKVFITDADLIEKVEKMRVGESFSVAGPFSIGTFRGQEQLQISAYALINSNEPRKAKGKKQIRREQSTVSDEADNAPADDVGGPNDEIPF